MFNTLFNNYYINKFKIELFSINIFYVKYNYADSRIFRAVFRVYVCR